MSEQLAFAVAAGMLAAVNPCGFAMLPGYLTLFVASSGGGGSEPTRWTAVRRALTATAAMTGGFLLVFGTFGLLLAPVASTVQRWLPAFTVLIGAVLIVLGLLMLAGKNVLVRTPKVRLGRSPASGVMAMAVYGVSYAIASLGCTIGPFLVVTTTTFRSGQVLTGVAGYAAYAVGMGLVVGVLAVAAALAQQSAAAGLRRALPYVNRVGGALLVVAGGYVAWYGTYELRVFAGGDAADPIVAAAGAIQGSVAGWVGRLGVIPFAIALAVLLVGTILAATLGRRGTSGSTATPATADQNGRTPPAERH